MSYSLHIDVVNLTSGSVGLSTRLGVAPMELWTCAYMAFGLVPAVILPDQSDAGFPGLVVRLPPAQQ